MKNKGGIKLVHWFPFVFTLGLTSLPFLSIINNWLALAGVAGYSLYFTLMFLMATIKEKSPLVGILSCTTSIIQLAGYGAGFFVTLLRYKLNPPSKD